MCGIFGLISTGSDLIEKEYKSILHRLFILSESRGKEAAGLCTIDEEKITIVKAANRAREFLKSNEYLEAIEEQAAKAQRVAMGHARMVTNGDVCNAQNNQPVANSEIVCIHNGIIVNDSDLWKENRDLERKAQVDTEILVELVKKYDKGNLGKAFNQAIKDIEGSVSVALTSIHTHELLLYTNTGSLYMVRSRNGKHLLFASERYIIEKVIKDINIDKKFSSRKIRKLIPGKGLIIDLKTLKLFNLEEERERCIYDKKIYCRNIGQKKIKYQSNYSALDITKLEKLMEIDDTKIKKLRRCSKCLLPETFPGIQFDQKGVCSICRSYKKKEFLGDKKLLNKIYKNRKNDSNYDCIIPISGGRDSCYCLHYAVRKLKLRPVAYTYDWGMVTDLARRNIQRMCSQLQVEHILISADIQRKRNNVKLNVEAWLKKPNIATIPLFMAGDKQFFYYAQMLKRQMKIDSILFGMNSLEETNFKVAFTGINGKSEDGIFYNLSPQNKAGMCLYYGREFIKNPSFINASLLDTLGGYISYYLLPKNYIQFFDYIGWEENEISNTILNEYGWEKANDTLSTWRIGDGTAPFYNYIYYRICGFSEYDTFRSNQIREGMLTREEALSRIYEENRPRAEAFNEYCKTIGIDALEAVKIINKQDTLYE